MNFNLLVKFFIKLGKKFSHFFFVFSQNKIGKSFPALAFSFVVREEIVGLWLIIKRHVLWMKQSLVIRIDPKLKFFYEILGLWSTTRLTLNRFTWKYIVVKLLLSLRDKIPVQWPVVLIFPLLNLVWNRHCCCM